MENRRQGGHWQNELALDLRGRGEQVFYPQLPDTDRPSLEAWVEAVLAELELMRGEKVVVCHSLACTTWLHVSAAVPAAADRLLLVSPPGPGVFDWDVIAGFDPAALDLGRLKLAAATPRLACSDNDPYCPEGAEAVFGGPLGCDVDLLPGAGHITYDDGYGNWPSALAWCLDPAERLAHNR
ncbi:hypothetical protein GCM10009830_33560 [Glycomyces endophyticus]|uniref:Alpha/beta hydrolase n=1 Tax=Glycomyces endophyticus TaxID=480996 RepID=A0ABN2H8B7_9ACTN